MVVVRELFRFTALRPIFKEDKMLHQRIMGGKICDKQPIATIENAGLKDIRSYECPERRQKGLKKACTLMIGQHLFCPKWGISLSDRSIVLLDTINRVMEEVP